MAAELLTSTPTKHDFGWGIAKCTMCGASGCLNRGCMETRRVVCNKCWPKYVKERSDAGSDDSTTMISATMSVISPDEDDLSDADANNSPSMAVVAVSSPKVLDRIAPIFISYISPTLTWACNKVPMLGGVKQRIEPYALEVIQKADACIDTAYIRVKDRATALGDVVTSIGGKSWKMIGDSFVVTRMHATSLVLVSTLDRLVDRLLPEQRIKDEEGEAKDAVVTRDKALATVGL